MQAYGSQAELHSGMHRRNAARSMSRAIDVLSCTDRHKLCSICQMSDKLLHAGMLLTCSAWVWDSNSTKMEPLKSRLTVWRRRRTPLVGATWAKLSCSD